MVDRLLPGPRCALSRKPGGRRSGGPGHRRGAELVAPRLLRYDEEQGLLSPQRTDAGYREYAEADLDVVHHVRTLLAAGLSTATIADLLPCMGADGPRLVASCPELLDDLHRERDRLTAMIDELAAARDGLLDQRVGLGDGVGRERDGQRPELLHAEDARGGRPAAVEELAGRQRAGHHPR